MNEILNLGYYSVFLFSDNQAAHQPYVSISKSIQKSVINSTRISEVSKDFKVVNMASVSLPIYEGFTKFAIWPVLDSVSNDDIKFFAMIK